MKPGKVILVILVILVVLLIIAYFVGRSNRQKITSAIMTQPPANGDVTGRFIAAIPRVDFTQTYNGQPVYIWVGPRGACQSGYMKIVSGELAGWCVLNTWSERSKPTKSAGENRQWCCAEYDTSGNCKSWESRPIGDKCSSSSNI